MGMNGVGDPEMVFEGIQDIFSAEPPAKVSKASMPKQASNTVSVLAISKCLTLSRFARS
jgi:hypothetical protein